MNQDLPSVFEELEPPRDGLADLRVRIATERGGRASRRRLRVAAAAATLAVVAALVFYPAIDRPGPLPVGSSPMAIRLGLADAADEPVIVPLGRRAEMAAQRVPLADERVVLYLVAPRISEPDPAQPPMR